MFKSLLATITVALTLGATGVHADCAEPEPTDERPNVVVIITDDMTWQQRQAIPRTWSWFRNHGTVWDHYHISLPWCCPSRATFITGQYARNHGVLTSTAPYGGYPKLDNTNTLPVWLQDAGYRTGHVGKYLNELPVGTIPPGYNDWQGISGSTRPYYDYTINDNGESVYYGTGEQDYITDVLSARSVEALRDMSAAGEPFYLSIGSSAPHVGVNNSVPTPAPRHEHLYDTATMPRPSSFNEADISDKPAYVRNRAPLTPTAVAIIENRWRNEMESLRAVDDMVINVIRTLEETGELDNTVIVFTSDNGFMHGEHRIPGDKRVPYRESIQVPLMAAGPGFTAGLWNTAFVSNVDIVPSVIQATGVTPRRDMDGDPLQPTTAVTAMPERSILIERYDRDCFQGLISDEWWYVHYVTGEEELYPYKATWQLRNEASWPKRQPVLAELRQRLDAMVGGRLEWCEH